MSVSYCLTEENSLIVDYSAQADQATPVNLTNHSYFNLNGHDAGSLCGHTMQINSGKVTNTDATLIPAGELTAVAGTEDDYRQPRELLADTDHLHDLNYVLSSELWTLLRCVVSVWTEDLRMDTIYVNPDSSAELHANVLGIFREITSALKRSVSFETGCFFSPMRRRGK